MKKLVRDLMHPGLLTCNSEATLGQVASSLTQYHVHALIVVDHENHPQGIISDYDLLAGEWLSEEPQGLATMRHLTAGDLMSSPIETVEADTPIKTAAHLLVEKDIHRLLVTEKGIPTGVISTSDFVSSIAREEKPKRETVADVMSDAILVCRDKTPLSSAAGWLALGTRSGCKRQAGGRGKREGPVTLCGKRGR
jgi:CBS domain-containing protein